MVLIKIIDSYVGSHLSIRFLHVFGMADIEFNHILNKIKINKRKQIHII